MAHAADGLELLIVIGEDGQEKKPTLQYCMDYAQQKGVDPARVYIDFGNNSWDTLFGALESYGQGGFSLPWQGILRAQSMEYIWNSVVGEGSAMSVLDELFAL